MILTLTMRIHAGWKSRKGQVPQGAFGYPNLRDDSWLCGQGHAQGHPPDHSCMAFEPTIPKREIITCPRSAEAVSWTEPQIGDAAEYVLSLSGKADDKAAADRGAKISADNCTPCHGADGERGISAARCAQPHGRALALCRRQGDGDSDTIRNGRGGVNADLGPSSRSRDDQRAGHLRPFAGRRSVVEVDHMWRGKLGNIGPAFRAYCSMRP